MPIIKCRLASGGASPGGKGKGGKGGGGGGLPADISLGVANGAAAVGLVRRAVQAVPPLRPLCLAVKSLLRERSMNEVFTGGLSSYAVVNMVSSRSRSGGLLGRGGGGAAVGKTKAKGPSLPSRATLALLLVGCPCLPAPTLEHSCQPSLRE